MEKRGGYQCTFVTASIILTAGSLAVGICFFSPWWLQNVGLRNVTASEPQTYIIINNTSGPNITKFYPHRGLWAQCGAECVWFWNSEYSLQKNMFTPLKWHVACQVLYAVAGVIMLVCEIYARVQMCCTQKSSVFLSLGILVLISALLQIATFATFGGGAYASYKVISDPRDIVAYWANLGESYWNGNTSPPSFIGWSFWMGVVGSMLSIISGVFFLITYCGFRCGCCRCCDRD